jgi:hypothetical protein
VTIVSGGSHPHFHQPTDTGETVHREILEAATRYLLTVTWHLANEPEAAQRLGNIEQR